MLSIWTERRTTAQLCQEMDISPALLGQWQNLAIEGMLKALDPKKKDPLPPLNHRLTRLIEKKLAEPDSAAGEAARRRSRRRKRPSLRNRGQLSWENVQSAQQTARLRAEMIMKVRCGLMTAQQAADRLGVSRKTYYKWEQRGLSALLDGMADQSPGRPVHPSDEHRQSLERQLTEANRQIELLNRKMALKDVLMELKLPTTGCDRAKKK